MHQALLANRSRRHDVRCVSTTCASPPWAAAVHTLPDSVNIAEVFKDKNTQRDSYQSLGSLSNDDGEVNENGKKNSRFRLAKQQLCTRIVNCNFFVICLPTDH